MPFEELNAMHRLNEIHFLTLVVCREVCCEHDVADVLAIADLLESRIACVRKVLFPRVAHVPNMEMPDLFDRLVEFLVWCRSLIATTS